MDDNRSKAGDFDDVNKQSVSELQKVRGAITAIQKQVLAIEHDERDLLFGAFLHSLTMVRRGLDTVVDASGALYDQGYQRETRSFKTSIKTIRRNYSKGLYGNVDTAEREMLYEHKALSLRLSALGMQYEKSVDEACEQADVEVILAYHRCVNHVATCLNITLPDAAKLIGHYQTEATTDDDNPPDPA